MKNQKSSLLYERDNEREKYIGKTLYENLCKTITWNRFIWMDRTKVLRNFQFELNGPFVKGPINDRDRLKSIA